jgi:hypothetical protein
MMSLHGESVSAGTLVSDLWLQAERLGRDRMNTAGNMIIPVLKFRAAYNAGDVLVPRYNAGEDVGPFKC